MRLLTFHGGVHPDDGKAMSKDRPITPMEAGDTVYISLSQHIGAPAKPVVEKGDHVLAGQLIGEAGGFVSSPVYATVSGEVTGFQKCRTPQGGMADCVVIRNDHQNESVEFEPADFHALTKEEILDRIKKGGIVGMGGAGFPTHVKLSPKEPEKIDYVLVNGAECEPYLTSDYRRMLEEPEKLVGGLQIILKLFPKAKGYICIEANKMDCVEAMRKACAGIDNIEVKVLKVKYPQGAERMLIYAATGRKLNSRLLPADVGCVVDNVDTVVGIYNAVALGRPLMHRIITVTGDAVKEPCNYYVPYGMLFSELLEKAGGLKNDAEKIIIGGPMMGNPVFELEIPVIKTSSALLALTKDEVAALEPTACINCGRCSDVCPGQVLPSRLSVFAENGDAESFQAYGGMECCECGCCSFICPAKRPLTQVIKSMRKVVLASRKKG